VKNEGKKVGKKEEEVREERR